MQHFRRNNFNLDEITLAPLADSGFTANRVNLCQQFNPTAANNTFCPDPNATDPNDPVIAQAVAGVFPNQLKSALACDGLLYLPNVGAQPEPPVAAGVNLNTNVQALVHVVDIASLAEREDLTVNLNQQIATEPDRRTRRRGASPTCSAMRSWRWTRTTTARTSSSSAAAATSCSRRSWSRRQARHRRPEQRLRFQTGNIPTGIVVDEEGELGFVNNQVNMSVSVLDLEANTVLEDVPSSTPPNRASLTIRDRGPAGFSSRRSACRTTAWSACRCATSSPWTSAASSQETPGAPAARATTRVWPMA